MRLFRHPRWQHLDYRVKVATTQENKPPTQGTRQWTFTTPRWRCGSILLPSLNAGVPKPTGGIDSTRHVQNKRCIVVEIVDQWSTRTPPTTTAKSKWHVWTWPLTSWPGNGARHMVSSSWLVFVPHNEYNPWNKGSVTSGHSMRDWQTDGRADRVKPIYPTQLCWAGV